MANYPRPGCRIAPHLLHPELNVPVQVTTVDGAVQQVLLCDLDETSWQRYSAETCVWLSRQVINRITAIISMALLSDTRKHQGMFVQKPPQLPPGMSLIDLPLEDATISTLQKEGLLNDPEAFDTMSIRDLTMIPRFGSRRLVDLLTAIETCLAGYRPDRQAAAAPVVEPESVTAWASRLHRRFGVLRITQKDPRLGWQIRSLDRRAKNLADLIDRIQTGQLEQTPQVVAEKMQRLEQSIAHQAGLTIEAELASVVLHSGVKPRHGALLCRYRGWDGGGEGTLQSVGDANGLTRERVRQITTLAEQTLQGQEIYTPVLDRVLALARQLAPCSAGHIEEALLQKGLSGRYFHFDGILSAARLLRKNCPLVMVEFNGRQFVTLRGLEELPALAHGVAYRNVEHWGADRIANVTAEVSRKLNQMITDATVANALALNDDFRFLDDEGGWYWLANVKRSRVLNHMEKIFCVCEELNITELLEGVVRSYRMQETVLPKKILLEMCRQIDWLEVSHWKMVKRLQVPDADKVLSASERTITAILKENNNIMTWGQLKNYCLAAGMVKVTYDVTIMNSPIFKKIAKGTYGLRGVEVTSDALAGCLPKTSGFRPTRSKQDAGVLPDGRLYIVFRVTEYLLRSGLVFIPAIFRERITHGHYTLVDAQDARLGTLSCYNASNLYGIKKIIKAQGWGLNDRFKLTFDLPQRQVKIERLGVAAAEGSAAATEMLRI